MCANYIPPAPRALRERLHAREPDFSYAAEAYPANEALYLRAPPQAGPDGELQPVRARFGLLPAWARDDKLMRQTYNARSETVAQKPSFRNAWRRRQFCLIPVQRFFEPHYEGDRPPVRWRIERGDGEPFCVAGLWEAAWRDGPQSPAPAAPRPAPRAAARKPAQPETIDLWGEIDTPADPQPEPQPDPQPEPPSAPQPPARVLVHSFTMLTIGAEGHPMMSHFHAPDDEKRSLVILKPQDHLAWLQADEAQARALLQPFDAREFTCAPDPRPPRKRSA